MTKTMYRVGDPIIPIREYIVHRETDTSVWFTYTFAFMGMVGGRKEGSRREKKLSKHHRWFNTYNEAKVHLVHRARIQVADLERELDSAKIDLEKIRALK